jgi:hypothetical protein
MSMIDNKKIASFGALVAFSIVIGIFISNNKPLKEEIEGQLNSFLKTTGKLLRRYKNFGESIGGIDSGEIVETNDEWDKVALRNEEQ